MNLDDTIHTDPVLQALIAEANADPDVIGLVLAGMTIGRARSMTR